jgi:signal transduction histidine kinase
MRLGIRRKLIGTLMLVGLFPLVMSLVVILGGGAVISLRELRGRYDDTATMCADQIANALIHEELEKLIVISRLPVVNQYVRDHARLPAAATLPAYTPESKSLDEKWPGLTETDPEVAAILRNAATERLNLMSEVDGHRRHALIANAAGEVIAADSKTDDYFQADEYWWQIAWNHGRGRLYISTITTSNGGKGKLIPGEKVVEIAVPIIDTVDGKKVVIGILKDEVAASWVLATLRETPESKSLKALTQLIDLEPHPASDPAGGMRTVFFAGSAGEESAEVAAGKALAFYQTHLDGHVSEMTMLWNKLILGSSRVAIQDELHGTPSRSFPNAVLPHWAVVISKPSDEAMTSVYHAAGIVAAIGLGLILVLFILGVAISNREIIMPILRLREATAAVGRGELNMRLLSPEATVETFRKDELGELARDFDEMTRQLQKNVNQLARSNEAKRRFMELAGHELRTPVTYLLGVCQLAQKQLQVLSAVATDGVPEDERTLVLAGKNAQSISSALSKIAAKTQRLSRIIDNLLKLVNNDQFTTRMNKTQVDMRALILQVTSDHRPFIAERKEQLVVDVPPNLPALEADRDKLEDALSNLLSNAIRFSPDGSTIKLAAHEVIGDMLEILVEDSGPGIPQEDLNNLFEPFYTGPDILQHHSGEFEYGSRGLGLGLAIVRRFIELHGGIVRAHAVTKDGKTVGTQFQILLPLMKADNESSPPSPADKLT